MEPDEEGASGSNALGLSSRKKDKKSRMDEREDFFAAAEPSAEDLEAFDELLETQNSRKVMKRKQMEERAKAFVPSVPEEVEGQRGRESLISYFICRHSRHISTT